MVCGPILGVFFFSWVEHTKRRFFSAELFPWVGLLDAVGPEVRQRVFF